MTYGGTLFAAYYAQHQEQLPPDDEVWYWADEQVTLYSQTGVASHTFNDGNGVVKLNNMITSIGNTFKESEIKRIVLPSTTLDIGVDAFTRCYSLSSVSIPDSVQSIGGYAFSNCSLLSMQKLPSSLVTIGTRAFSDCTLFNVPLPDGIETISDHAFYNDSALSAHALPSSLRTIGADAFTRTDVGFEKIPQSVETISSDVFYGCSGIYSLVFDGVPQSISSLALRSCVNLTNIYVPWSEGEVANAPWGATNATIHYNYTT